MRGQPVHLVRTETKGHDHRVGINDVLGTWHLLSNLAAIGIRCTQLGTNHFHSGHATGAVEFDAQWLQVEFEINPFLTRVFHFAFGAWHVGFITAVGADNVGCPLANRGTHAVHRGVTTAQHHHTFTFHADIRLVLLGLIAHQLLGVGDQERQGVIDPRRILVLQATAH
ncbi:hypothetical protein D3C80_908650 [compost metagenome]